MDTKPTDEEILAVLRANKGGVNPTYYIKNLLRRAEYKGLDTPFVLRRLKALEKLGKVVRTTSSYATQICWDIPKEAV